MLISVIACLCATLAALGWIGWRFFIAPLSGTRALQPASIETARAVQACDRSREKNNAVHLLFGQPNLGGSSPLWLAILFAAASVAGVLTFSASVSLDPLTAQDLGRQKHIQAALNPEALVPPPPLPPSVFAGTERPGLETANRDWSRLNPDFMQRALLVFARMEARGYQLALLEGYRSPDRQDALAESAVHVTNARAYQSKHQYGLALDAAPVRNGRLVISERDAWAMQAYEALGEEAEKAGLIWGGRWKLKDYGHIEAAGAISEFLKSR